MTSFMMPVLGGVFIGLSATLLLLLIGRIAGISGIVWGAIFTRFDSMTFEKTWRWFFIIGLMLGAWLFHKVSGISYPFIDANFPLAVIAGLCVGAGVNIGNGCTSGHGVCGIGRLSLRSMIATVCFMLTAICTVLLSKLMVAL